MTNQSDPGDGYRVTVNDRIDAFWDIICGMLPLFRILTVINVVFLAFLLLSLPFNEPGSPVYVVTQITIAFLSSMILTSVVVFRQCARRV